MKTIKQLIKEAQHIVVFSGAGFSTESNIPDFRSDTGIYKQNKYPYPSEVMLSHDFYVSHPKAFYEFYRNEMIYLDAKPNKGHEAVAKLEQLGKLEAVITQNIDGLHQKAGNQKVIELHGSIHRNYCVNCHTFYDVTKVIDQEIPTCEKCKGSIKPDVVLYQEGLSQETIEAAINAIRRADLLIVAGTSLVVYPAAGLIDYYLGNDLILINHSETSADSRATCISRENIGEVLDFVNTEM